MSGVDDPSWGRLSFFLYVLTSWHLSSIQSWVGKCACSSRCIGMCNSKDRVTEKDVVSFNLPRISITDIRDEICPFLSQMMTLTAVPLTESDSFDSRTRFHVQLACFYGTSSHCHALMVLVVLKAMKSTWSILLTQFWLGHPDGITLLTTSGMEIINDARHDTLPLVAVATLMTLSYESGTVSYAKLWVSIQQTKSLKWPSISFTPEFL